ncbi:alcohol dehydrogenase [Apiospora saccharicola]|uniref:Alcohol dehydrogenase n=1 Tax=Apiospora saccharicola TaxID=335842 RepID=A0ABR1TGA5_9PEZI
MSSLTHRESQMAIIAGPTGEFEVSTSVPIPEIGPKDVLVQTKAVALNPVDTKLVGDFVTPGCIFGFDCAGIVVAIGRDVKKDVKIGDRVCGCASGMNKDKPLAGAFAEYVSFPGDLTLKVPESMSIEEAASLGTAMASASMVLFWSLGMPLSLLDAAHKVAEQAAEGQPADPLPTFLVYGGSTSTGTMMLQLLHLCGFPTIATCSAANFDLVKSYGADQVYDYKASNCAQTIRQATGNTLEYIVDCYAEDSSMRFCYEAMGRAGGYYTALNPFNDALATRKVITPDWILATRIAGDGSKWPAPYACEYEPRLAALAGPLFNKIQQLLDLGKLRPNRVWVQEGGLPGLLNGVGIIRRGEVSGQKLVYPVA